ncbi:MAG: SUMF1/EgtB/PvdO family nonheme iron enzyme [Opitutales bacterium]
MPDDEKQFGSPEPDSNHASKNLSNPALKPGENFGNYRVVRSLCRSLLADYYHMEHIRDRRAVTVGVFHPRTVNDPNCLNRLESLRKILQNIEHEGVPKIRNCSLIKGRHCIFLDPVKGKTLSRYFAERGDPGQAGIDPDEATLILASLLGLLGFVHSKGVDHRDLDSDLVYVGEDGSLQVLGLGVKAALGRETFESVVSASVSPLESNKVPERLNSFDIMSPEYKAGKPEDSRVDIYAAGFTGYWLLSGKKPSLAHYQPISELAPDLPKGWDVFFDKTLQLEPEQRYQSCKTALVGLKSTDPEPESKEEGFIQRQIDRIPVPKGIRARGEAAARTFRLSLIGVVGVTLTALAASFVEVVFTEAEPYTKQVALVSEAGRTPDLRLLVEPERARVTFKGFESRFITMGGQLDLLIQPGEYKIGVTAPGYLEKELNVEVIQEGTKEISVELLPEKIPVAIRSEPEASIVLEAADGASHELGKTDKDGRLYKERGVSPGTYTIIARKKGYEEGVVKGREIKRGEDAEFEVPLEPKPAVLFVFSAPPGARVIVNEREAGATPLYVESLQPETNYFVTLRLEGYRPAQRMVAMEPGEERAMDFGMLAPKSGALVFEPVFKRPGDAEPSSLRSDVRAALGDERFSLDDPRLQKIPEGEYTVVLEHPDFRAQAQAITVKDGKKTTVRGVLEPRPAQVELKLPKDFDPGARVDGEEVKVEAGKVPVPANKEVEFELRFRDHMTMRRELNLGPAESFVWDVEPVPIPGPEFEENWKAPRLGMEFSWIEPGEFTMGSPPAEPGRLPNEGPRTEVRFTRGFWIGRYEVTQAEYSRLMDENPSNFRGESLPVDSVTWGEAQAFCKALTERERAAGRLPDGYVYRLPVEAEWAYAARAGTSTPFSFGKEANGSDGNFGGVYPRGSGGNDSGSDEVYGTQQVGSYEPNANGLYDVHGNVEEWMLDAYNGRLPGGALEDPDPREEGRRRTVRGGSWQDSATRARSAVREGRSQGIRSDAVGFRVALAPDRK